MKKNAPLERRAPLRQRRPPTSGSKEPPLSAPPPGPQGLADENAELRQETARLREETASLRARHDWLKAERSRLIPDSGTAQDALDSKSRDLANALGQLQSSFLRYSYLFDCAPVGDAIVASNG